MKRGSNLLRALICCYDNAFFFCSFQRVWWKEIVTWAPWRPRTLAWLTESWFTHPKLARMSLSWCRRSRQQPPARRLSQSQRLQRRPPQAPAHPPRTNLSPEVSPEQCHSNVWCRIPPACVRVCVCVCVFSALLRADILATQHTSLKGGGCVDEQGQARWRWSLTNKLLVLPALYCYI